MREPTEKHFAAVEGGTSLAKKWDSRKEVPIDGGLTWRVVSGLLGLSRRVTIYVIPLMGHLFAGPDVLEFYAAAGMAYLLRKASASQAIFVSSQTLRICLDNKFFWKASDCFK